MNTERIRNQFETRNPLPEGVHWDGEFYSGTHNVIGSYSNATVWNHMYSGFCQGYTAFGDLISREVLS